MMDNTISSRWKIFTFSILFLIANYINIASAQEAYNIVYNQKPLFKEGEKIGLQFLFKIGGLEATDDEYILYRPNDVALDLNGNIYILNYLDCRIQVYDKNGKYIKTIGRRGEGPGEFILPFSFEIYKNNLLYVNDASRFTGFSSGGNNFMKIFNMDGKELERIKFDKEWRNKHFKFLNNSETILLPYYIWNDGSYSISARKVPEGMYRVPSIRFYDLKGELLNTLQFNDIKWTYDNKEDYLNFSGYDFHFTIDGKDNIYATFEYKNRIEKFTPDGKLVMRILRQKDYKETTKSKKIVLQKKGDRVLSSTVLANVFSYAIDIDYLDRIWIMSLKRQLNEKDYELKIKEQISGHLPVKGIAQFEVFNKDGELLSIIPWDYYINDIKLRIFNDLLIVLDSYYNMAAYVYKIVDK